MASSDETARIPPGQYLTERFPVLHAGVVPAIDLAEWDFTVGGLVEHPLRFTYDEIRQLPAVEVEVDIHCVTKWSKLDTRWEGLPIAEIFDRAVPKQQATHALIRAEHGFTANLPLSDLAVHDNLLAYRYDGDELTPDHGWPLRLVVPHRYFWKSVKWVRAIEFLDHDEPGFWERNGYHMVGDPWREQRYWGD